MNESGRGYEGLRPPRADEVVMHPLEAFAEITKVNEPLAPYSHFKLGGPADYLVAPNTRAELAGVVRRCFETSLPLRVLGSGCNLLIRDEGVRGAVLRLTAPAFTEISVNDRRVRAGCGSDMSALISHAARHHLAGLEMLVGIPGSVGGALRTNAGDRTGDTSQFVRKVEIMDDHGDVHVRERDELRFDDYASNLDDPVLLTAEFELERGQPDAIVKRMRKAWIQRKKSQPLSFQAAVRIFRNPKGFNAADLIEQAGLAKTRVGGVEVSERNASYFVAHQGATARDVLRLIELVRSKVQERFNIELDLEIGIW